MLMIIIKLLVLIGWVLIGTQAHATNNNLDPLDSPGWNVMHEFILGGEPVVFDDRVIINIPEFAEDPLNVPVSIRIEGIKDIQDIVIFADMNPIQKVLNFKPVKIEPYIAFRIKVEQSTPIRAAVKTSDGVWHVGGKWLEAAGGGCSAPSHGMVHGDWQQTLMNVSSRYWSKGDINRLRFRIMHPMDTGLAPGIPEFYVKNFSILNEAGQTLALLNTYQPISENPVFTFELKKNSSVEQLHLVGMDNNGNRLTATIQ